MKKRNNTSRTTLRLLATAMIVCISLPGGAWAANPVPLSQVPIPTPPNLGDFVKDKAAAIKLGKALFWDMQVGSDGVTACATCHFSAGEDNRLKNILNPGPDGAFQLPVTGPGAGATLIAADFPFTQVLNPADPNTKLKNGLTINNNGLGFNDIGGSPGVHLTLFNAIGAGPFDNGTPLTDLVFPNLRQVTGRNAPSAVNAIFNYDNFWDGRAKNIFNGNNPIGPLDVNAGIWVEVLDTFASPSLVKKPVAIPNASLASQATGPPLSSVEMSYSGRTWPKLGRKLLNPALVPLVEQLVDINDSVLGPLSKQNGGHAGTPGINTTYADMVKTAFNDTLWNSGLPTPDGFTQMEENFSLFWGLAVQLYEATLISDQTPFDRYLAGDNNAMSATAVAGFKTFQSKCGMCHDGTELSDATVSFALANGLIEKGQTKAGGAISDVGFHNIGVRPTVDDKGRGGVINFDLSFSKEALDAALNPPAIPFAPPQPLPAGFPATAAVDGSFKTPQLRNIAMRAPYMHNGSMLTLDEVIEFYSRSGNFNNPELANDINQPQGVVAKKAELLAFFDALTDPRVAADKAPFDHPQLFLPNGNVEVKDVNNTFTFDPVANAANYTVLPATGGSLPGLTFDLAAFLQRPLETTTLATLPKAAVTGAPTGATNQTTATMTVAVENGDQYIYSTDGGVTFSAPQPASTPLTLNNLADGAKTCIVIGVNSGTGHKQFQASAPTASWTVKTTAPKVTVGTVEAMTRKTTQTITGTVEAGGKVAVKVDTDAVVGPVTVTGTTWSCQVSGLNKGSNNITVVATDVAGNTAATTATTKILIADGCFRGTGSPDISDALKSLKMAVGIITPTEDDLLHGDVATDGKIDSGDSLLILKKVLGLASF